MRYWPIVRGIHRPPVNFPHKGQWRVKFTHKGQWRGALVFLDLRLNKQSSKQSWGCDLRRHRANYDATVMEFSKSSYNGHATTHHSEKSWRQFQRNMIPKYYTFNTRKCVSKCRPSGLSVLNGKAVVPKIKHIFAGQKNPWYWPRETEITRSPVMIYRNDKLCYQSSKYDYIKEYIYCDLIL